MAWRVQAEVTGYCIRVLSAGKARLARVSSYLCSVTSWIPGSALRPRNDGAACWLAFPLSPAPSPAEGEGNVLISVFAGARTSRFKAALSH